MTGDRGEDEVFAHILINGGLLGAQLRPGTEARHLLMSGAQFARLAEHFQSWEVLHAIGLIVEHGDLAFNPLRIEVPGWSQGWLEGHGMPTSKARSAANALKKAGFMSKVFGSAGAAGGAVGVLSGSRFGMGRDAVAQVTTETGRTRLALVTAPVDNSATSQVTPRLAPRDETRTSPVDNPVSSFGDPSPKRPEPSDGSDVDAQNAETANREVSAFGRAVAERTTRPAPSKEVQEGESLLAASPGAAVPLTRANLHRFLGDPAVVAALRTRPEAEVIATLAEVYAARPDRTVAALDFFDRTHGDPERGDRVDADLGWLVYDLLTVPEESLGPVAASLRTLLDDKQARIPKQGDRELLLSTVVTLTATMDSQVDSWPRYVVWAMKQPGWKSSAALTRLVTALNRLVADPPVAPSASTANATPAPAPEAGTGTTAPTPRRSTIEGLPQRDADRAPMTLVDMEMDARGDGYWDWLRDIAEATEFGGMTFDAVVRRSRRIQEVVIKQHYAQQTG